MSITAIFVVFAVTWFLSLFVVMALNQRSQEDAGDVVPGTPAGAPEDPKMGRKALITTAVAVVITTLAAIVISSGVITVEDIDIWGRMD